MGKTSIFGSQMLADSALSDATQQPTSRFHGTKPRTYGYMVATWIFLSFCFTTVFVVNYLVLVPETGVEPVRPLFTKRRILSPMCLPISPLGHGCIVKQKSPVVANHGAFRNKFKPKPGGATQSRTGLDGFARRCSLLKSTTYEAAT